MIQVPTIETQRLMLRLPALSDFEPLCAFYASPRADFVGGQMERDRVWRHLALEIGHWHLRGYGRWTLVEKDSGKAAGWDLFEGFGGKGYATEAATAARTFAYETLGWTTAISLVAPDNHGSRAVAQRLGASRDGDFTHVRLGALEVWRHMSPDDLAAGGMEGYA
jgi:RimJ/RimL family protein N-acetyltransferase